MSTSVTRVVGVRGKAQRAGLVAAAAHSGEMEGLTISSATESDAAAYVEGSITADVLMSRILGRRH